MVGEPDYYNMRSPLVGRLFSWVYDSGFAGKSVGGWCNIKCTMHTFDSAHCTAQSAHIHSAHPDVHSVAHIGAQSAHKLVHTLARFAQLIIAHGAAHGDNCRL